jgi:hypothetical protein
VSVIYKFRITWIKYIVDLLLAVHRVDIRELLYRNFLRIMKP